MNVLRLKHWQVFLLAWGPHAVSMMLLALAPKTIPAYFLVWFLLLIIGTFNCFIWVWRVMVEMKHIYPAANILAFKIAFWIPTMSILIFIADNAYNLFLHKRPPSEIDLLFVWACIGILSVVCMVTGLMLIGRMLRAVELKRTPSIREHLFESLLVLVVPVGVWVIQPRLNKIYASRKAFEV